MNDIALQFLKLVKSNSLPHIHGLLSTFVHQADENGWNSVHWAVKNDNLDLLLLLEALTDHTLSEPKSHTTPTVQPLPSPSSLSMARDSSIGQQPMLISTRSSTSSNGIETKSPSLPTPSSAAASSSPVNNSTTTSSATPNSPTTANVASLPSAGAIPSATQTNNVPPPTPTTVRAVISEMGGGGEGGPPSEAMRLSVTSHRNSLPSINESSAVQAPLSPSATVSDATLCDLPVGRPLDVSAPTTAEFDGYPVGSTPLHIAAKRGNSKMIKALIERGADVSRVDSSEHNCLWTLIHSPEAGEEVLEEGVALLLEAGCKPDPTLVLFLSRTQFANPLKQLLRVLVSDNILTASPVLYRGRDNGLPIHYASKGGNLEMVTALLEYGSLVNARDNQQNTPLHLANNVSVAHLLVSRGARGDLKNTEGVKASAAFEAGNDAKVLKQALQVFTSQTTATCVPGKPVILSDEATWIKDDKSETCMCCFSKFGLVNRKHHCRLCGILSCGNCSTKKLTLSDGQAIRVCDSCFNIKIREVTEAARPAPALPKRKDVRIHVTSLPSPAPTTTTAMESTKGGGGDFGGMGSADIAAAEKAANDKIIAEKAAAEKLAAEEKAANDKAVADRIALEKAQQERANAEKLAAEQEALRAEAEKNDRRAQLLEGRRAGKDKDAKDEGKKGIKGATSTTAEINNVMAQNKNKLIERGQKLDEAADRAEGLERSAEDFLAMATKLRKQQESSWF